MTLAAIGSAIYTVAVVLLLFGLTIFVHELGHFLVARRCGMVVDVFAIGFGPALWSRKIGGVVYKICLLPLGGYVALPQMDPSGGQGGDREKRVLPHISPIRKIAVALAGVTGNMILAILLAYVVFYGGKSFAPPANSLIGYVETNSGAYAAGLRIGDELRALNGEAIRNWDDVLLTTALHAGAAVTADVRRADGIVTNLVLPTETFMGNHYLPGLSPMTYCVVLRVVADSAAAAAGLQAADRITTFDSVTVMSREHLIELVGRRAEQATDIRILRDGQALDLSVTPHMDPVVKRARMGVEFNTLDVKPPWEQIESHASMIFRILRALVTPKQAKSAASGIGGPVAILTGFWYSVQASIILALWFTVMLNVNLAVLNLLPIPVLDGGHIMLSLWEMITRKPVSPRIVTAVWNGCAMVLIGLFLLLTYRDFKRIIPALSASKTNATATAVGVTNAAPTNAVPASP